MLNASINSMTFHHLLNSPIVTTIEIEKNSLFWETTPYRTGSRAKFLSLSLKTKTSIFRTTEVSSNSYHAETMMLWFKSWKYHLFSGTAKPSIRFYGSKTSGWLSSSFWSDQQSITLSLPQLPEQVGGQSPVSLKKSRLMTPLIWDLEVTIVQASIFTMTWKKTVVLLKGTQCETWLASFLHKQNKSIPHRAAFIWARHLQSLASPWIY